MSPAKARIFAQEQVGKKFNRLLILSITDPQRKWTIWVIARCECGVIKTYELTPIIKGHTKSCGCFKVDSFRAVIMKHGKVNHPLYNHWMAMKQRCYDENFKTYHNYGGRGITICDEWKNNFSNFYEWALLNGWQKGLSLDRFPDLNGSYTPYNCRWATRKQQSRNTRSNVFITFNGKSMCIADWAEEIGITQRRISTRLKRGWSAEKTLTTPLRQV